MAMRALKGRISRASSNLINRLRQTHVQPEIIEESDTSPILQDSISTAPTLADIKHGPSTHSTAPTLVDVEYAPSASDARRRNAMRRAARSRGWLGYLNQLSSNLDSRLSAPSASGAKLSPPSATRTSKSTLEALVNVERQDSAIGVDDGCFMPENDATTFTGKTPSFTTEGKAFSFAEESTGLSVPPFAKVNTPMVAELEVGEEIVMSSEGKKIRVERGIGRIHRKYSQKQEERTTRRQEKKILENIERSETQRLEMIRRGKEVVDRITPYPTRRSDQIVNTLQRLRNLRRKDSQAAESEEFSDEIRIAAQMSRIERARLVAACQAQFVQFGPSDFRERIQSWSDAEMRVRLRCSERDRAEI